ncbi:MAG: Fic family protein [Victivallales bacterium]|jgi:Fic family protein
MDTPKIIISEEILKLIATIDEFKGAWRAFQNLAPETLNRLRKVATVESIASSTRIEGAKLSDSEVEKLLSGVGLTSFRSRDEEEVAGYADAISLVFKSFKEINLTENHIRQLHQILLKYSDKDSRHRGEYKKLPNHVEAFDANGKSMGMIFQTATPFETPFKMRELVEWFENSEREQRQHKLILIAVFIVHFLAVHPFQDGNGRLSRIITTLLLMRAGYLYVPYSSLEHIVEENKDGYYLSLRRAQVTLNLDNSQLSEWIIFFLHSLKRQADMLAVKLDTEQKLISIPSLSQAILQASRERGTITIRDMVNITGASRNTIKAHVQNLVRKNLLFREGKGKGAWYHS